MIKYNMIFSSRNIWYDNGGWTVEGRHHRYQLYDKAAKLWISETSSSSDHQNAPYARRLKFIDTP